jgi:DNA-binding transcriptional MocR family regulator
MDRARERELRGSRPQRRRAARRRRPEGSTFCSSTCRRKIDERGIWGFLEDCIDDGVALAPGPSCGRDYGHWVRLCYTAAPPDQVLAAVDRLAARLR